MKCECSRAVGGERGGTGTQQGGRRCDSSTVAIAKMHLSTSCLRSKRLAGWV